MANLYSFKAAQTRLMREASYGVLGSTTWVRLSAMGVVLGPNVETDPFAPPGALIPTILLINDEFASGDGSGRLGYNDLLFPLASLWGDPTTTNLGGAPAAYQHQWLWNGSDPVFPVSYALDYGVPASAQRALGFLFNTLGISGGRSGGFEVSTSGFAKPLAAAGLLGGVTLERQTIQVSGTVSGGTYKIMVNGYQTAGIAHNANAATVLAALLLLPNIDTGDVIVGGGALPGTPMTLDFSGRYAGKNMALVTIDSSLLTGGGSYTVAETTPGADTVTDIAPVPANATQGNLWLDSTWAGIGTTQLRQAFNAEIQFGDRYQRVRPINKSKDSDDVIEVEDQDHRFSVTLAQNAVEQAQYALLQSGTPTFIRGEWEGDTISGANKFLLRIDECVAWQEVGAPEASDGALSRRYTGRMMRDAVSGNALRITLVNRQATLSP